MQILTRLSTEEIKRMYKTIHKVEWKSEGKRQQFRDGGKSRHLGKLDRGIVNNNRHC